MGSIQFNYIAGEVDDDLVDEIEGIEECPPVEPSAATSAAVRQAEVAVGKFCKASALQAGAAVEGISFSTEDVLSKMGDAFETERKFGSLDDELVADSLLQAKFLLDTNSEEIMLVGAPAPVPVRLCCTTQQRGMLD